jgi:hypothetical protein
MAGDMILCVSDDETGLLLDNSVETKEDDDQIERSEVQIQDRDQSRIEQGQTKQTSTPIFY